MLRNIEGIERTGSIDAQIKNIITEEAQAYLSGAKPAERLGISCTTESGYI